MNLPQSFPYGPRWGGILPLFAVGAAILAFSVMHPVFHRAGLALGSLPLALALAATVRRLVFPRFVELRQDTFVVCGGFLQARATEVPYTAIENGWEFATPRVRALTMKVNGRTVEISSRLMPDMASYVAVRDFLKSRFPPKQPQLVQAGMYCFRCSYEGNGEICDSNGGVLWRFRTLHPSGRPRYPYGVFRLPDFVVEDTTGKEIFRVRRVRAWPLGRFEMVHEGVPVCAIRQRSLLRNRYALEFPGGRRWWFRMPLFTVMFQGASEAGETVRVRFRTHNVWFVVVEPKADAPQLVAALAFIHRERLRFN